MTPNANGSCQLFTTTRVVRAADAAIPDGALGLPARSQAAGTGASGPSAAVVPDELTRRWQLYATRDAAETEAAAAQQQLDAAEAAATVGGVTGAERDRFHQSLQEALLARLREAPALEAVRAARQEFLAGLGPDKADLLRAEHRAPRPLAVDELHLHIVQRRLDEATCGYLAATPDAGARLAELGDLRFTPAALRLAAASGDADELQRDIIAAAAHFHQQHRPHGTLIDIALERAISDTAAEASTARHQITTS